MTVAVELTLPAALDIAARVLLLFLTVLVALEFRAVRRFQRATPSPIVPALLYVVATTGISIAYYLIIGAAPRELYLHLLDWGFVVQVPRVWAMLYLLKVTRGSL